MGKANLACVDLEVRKSHRPQEANNLSQLSVGLEPSELGIQSEAPGEKRVRNGVYYVINNNNDNINDNNNDDDDDDDNNHNNYDHDNYDHNNDNHDIDNHNNNN